MISLDITKQEIWISSILAIASSGLTRLITGPLNDKFGARWIMCTTLVMTGIPTGLAGLFVHSASALYWTRFAIGFAGSAFVSCQSWTSKMFAVEIAGTANALAAGWGNLGGGVAQIVMGAVLYPLFRKIYGGDSSDPLVEQQASELAWRTILVFPALMCFAMAFAVVRYSDDTPKGNVARLRREGKLQPVSAIDSLRKGASSWNTWILFIHYGLCFGTEITMTQAVSLYFKEEFGQSTASSAAIASVIGLMDLFARGLGGLASDLSNVKAGMRGRLWTQAIILLLEGALMMAFSRARTLVGAICGMILFSLFVQAAEGSTFAIVPYVDCSVTGSIAGIVGAGGNIGGICMSVMCLELEYRQAFLWMGAFAMMSSLLTCLLFVPGHRGLLGGEDSLEIQEQRRRADLPVEISLSALSQSPARDDDESL
jgi:NNP family nitrate/nitrite transporter-like MFS transporter